jgi:hypothetical protein
MYFLESNKGVIFSASTPCALILFFANFSGLFDPAGTPARQHPVKILKY